MAYYIEVVTDIEDFQLHRYVLRKRQMINMYVDDILQFIHKV